MNIKTIVVGPIETNCYITWGATKDAIVIDPGDDAQEILAALEAQGLTPCVYVFTHGHVDHISAVAELCATAPAPVAMHADDLKWAFGKANQLAPFFPAPARPNGSQRVLTDGQQCEDAGLRYEVMHTPGHSPGCICLLFPEQAALFCGDTLFAGSAGRTDLPGGDSRSLMQSLARLAKLPDATAVYPGHGPATTIAREKATNPFMRRR